MSGRAQTSSRTAGSVQPGGTGAGRGSWSWPECIRAKGSWDAMTRWSRCSSLPAWSCRRKRDEFSVRTAVVSGCESHPTEFPAFRYSLRPVICPAELRHHNKGGIFSFRYIGKPGTPAFFSAIKTIEHFSNFVKDVVPGFRDLLNPFCATCME